MTATPTPERLSFAEADARFGDELSRTLQGDFDTVLLLDGDVTIEGDFVEAVTRLNGGETPALVAITGDLTVKGAIALYEYSPSLLVSGYTRAETLEGGDAEIYIRDGTFDHLVYGYYNHGTLETGTVEVPWVINSDHDLRVTAPNAYLVDNFGDDDNADFAEDSIVDSFVPEVVDTRYNQIRISEFLKRLRVGLPVLKPGAKTAVEGALADVSAARAAKATELDLTDRKLKTFPVEILQMPWLRTLVLDGNPIGALPDGIGGLTALEHLSVDGCDLAALPASIGELVNLRVLRVGRNIRYDHPVDPPERALALPDAFDRLARLEELDVTGLSITPYGKGKALPEVSEFVLPDSAAGLVSLRRLVADRTNLVIPDGLRGLATLDEISMSGSSSCYLRKFPKFVTTFPNLRVLDLSGNFFRKIPKSLLNLKNLVRLDLGSSLGLVEKPLPDLSRLPALRTLVLSGRTNHTGVPVPPHTLLRQVIEMGLENLEHLEIDRWGPEKRGNRSPLTADLLAGIGAFRNLKRLDLSFNKLGSLPEDFFALTGLEYVDLRYNALDRTVRQRVFETFPDAQVDFRDQDGADSKAEQRELRAASALIEEANSLRNRGDYEAALAEYDRAITKLTDGSATSSYALLYAHYGKMWIYGKVAHSGWGTEMHQEQQKQRGIAEAFVCMRLVPPVWQIFHFTDEGQFHREVVRYATNFIAWEAIHRSESTVDDAVAALPLIEQGVACADGAEHTYLHDTHARVLLAAGRERDAWRAVQRGLDLDPDFDELQDLKADSRYQVWLHE